MNDAEYLAYIALKILAIPGCITSGVDELDKQRLFSISHRLAAKEKSCSRSSSKKRT